MALLFKLCIALILVSYSQAYLTGDSCRDYRNLFRRTWTRCELCAQQTCRCVYAEGRLQADCDPVHAVAPRVPYGCNIGANIQNDTHTTCCPIICPQHLNILQETCETSFGGSFTEGETWTKCGTDADCCRDTCQCVRRGGSLVETCQKACPGLLLESGCRVVLPFQNATHHNCCQIECQDEQQCTSNVGDKYNVDQTWDECLPGSCCQKSCTCAQHGDIVEPQCYTLCAKIAVRDGCTVVESPLSPTNHQCCKEECPVPETCTSSFGVDYIEGDSWSECSSGCCWDQCECTRMGGVLQKHCAALCANISPGCQIIDSIQNATVQDCCRTQCQENPGGNGYFP